MTSKTFESIGNCLELSVRKVDHENLVGVELRHTNGRWVGIASIAPSDAPALALAILEAAGLTVAKDDFKQGSVEDLLIDAALHLKGAIRLQERATAEARERAELEAEALELFKASGAYGSDRLFLKFGDLEETTQSAWLAVARRAREMRAEK